MKITAISSSIGGDKAALFVRDITKNKTSLFEEIVRSGILTDGEIKKRLEPSSLIHPPKLRRIYD